MFVRIAVAKEQYWILSSSPKVLLVANAYETTTVEFAYFAIWRGLEKSDDLGEVTNYANR